MPLALKISVLDLGGHAEHACVLAPRALFAGKIPDNLPITGGATSSSRPSTSSITPKATAMRIIRYQDSAGEIKSAAQSSDGSAREITGDIFGRHEVTHKAADVRKLLAPVVPTGIICIGLNYRRHAAEGNAPIPQWLVVL